MDEISRTRWYRLLEMLPGAGSWSILIVPIVAAFWFPRAVATFITLYILVWFWRSMKSSLFMIFSYVKSRKFQALNWRHLLSFFSDQPPAAATKMEVETQERIARLKAEGLFKTADSVLHVVIIPTYKEEKEILETSIEALTKVDFPLDRIILVLATEERDQARGQANAAYLETRFGSSFRHFYHFMHPARMVGELPAKGANLTYAGKKIAAILQEQGVDFSNVLVTTLDADNRPHPAYFANLTYHYLMEPKRAKRSFQPLAFFYNNIWDVPFTNRLIAVANTFWFLSESGESDHLFNASVYAQSLDTLEAMNFWSCQTIVEDLHQYWRTYFYCEGDYAVVPLFIPVYQDALQSRTYFTSLVGQYKQLRRWAWGASEIPYIVIRMWRERKKIPFFKTFSRLSYLTYLQLMWTAPVIILLNKSIPVFLNPKFANSLFAFNLGEIYNLVFTIVTVAVIISLMIFVLSLPRPRGHIRFFQFISILIQWIAIPFVTLIYGAIPALDAQTRLMLNRPLAFTVTEKIRVIR